ncbi:MAG: efflux RND transporter permease subunit [Proteobacteria bacterium]|nr:efflux RND transporter permease subunit [Pseudomonadota bacterium]
MLSNKLESFFKKIIDLRFYILVLFGFIALFGFYSLNKIKIDAIPDITNKQVVVNTKTFGMDPTKVEKSVTYPIESELYGCSGLVEMRSLSKFGLSQITLIFKDEIDINFARNQVLQRLSAIGDQLPISIKPTIAPLTTGIGEIIIYRVYNPQGSDNLMELRTVQEYQIARELKKISGVAEVDTIGGFERQLHLNIDPEKILGYGMTEKKLIDQIQTIGENSGGGYIEKDNQQKIVRTFSGIKNFEDVMNIPVKIDYSGSVLPLRKVVEIKQEYSQRLGSATYSSEEAVLGTVMLQSGENAQEVLTKVKSEIAKFNQHSASAKIEILYDRQFLINSTIKTVMRNLAEGILLVVGVLCLVLGNIRVGLIVASSLLFCIFILSACMNIFGISANLMSLGALDFGLLVDSSVVMVEYFVSRLIFTKDDKTKTDSIAQLSAQVARPIFIGITIIILVYVPILMFSGIEGKTFKPMAINVIIAMVASLFTAFFLMPVLSFFLIKDVAHKEGSFFAKAAKFYSSLLEKALSENRKVILGCLAFFILSFCLLPFIASDFLPSLNEGDIVYTLVAPEGTSLSKTTDLAKKLEESIKNEAEIDKIFSRIGTSQSGLDPMPQNAGDLFVILKQDQKSNAKKISEKLLLTLKSNGCEGCEITQTQPIEMRFNEMLEGSRADLSLRIFGDDLNVLMEITKKIKTLLQQKPQVKEAGEDFINSIHKGLFVDVIPDYNKIVKNRINLSDVNNSLSEAMVGVEVGKFYATEFPIAIILHLSEENRDRINSIKNIPVGLADGGSFPLSNVVNIDESQDINSIPRLFGKRYSGISIYLKDTDYSSFIAAAEKEIAQNNIVPNGYTLEWGGRFENLSNAKKQIFTIIPLMIFAIFFILYKMFKSAAKTLVVFSCVPFALSGAIVFLFVFQIPITISVYVGFIALIGISLLNSIILINSLNDQNDLKSVCLSRFRPILMTAAVASLGFLPMAFGQGIGAEVQQPIAITVIGGIISSTISTLILSPVLIRKFLKI